MVPVLLMFDLEQSFDSREEKLQFSTVHQCTFKVNNKIFQCIRQVFFAGFEKEIQWWVNFLLSSRNNSTKK